MISINSERFHRRRGPPIGEVSAEPWPEAASEFTDAMAELRAVRFPPPAVPCLGLRRRVHLMSLLAASLALTGCSGTLVSDMDFHAPSKWIAAPSIGGRELWINPDDPYEVVMVQRPGGAITTVARPVKNGHHVLFSNNPVTICGSHHAVLSHFEMYSKGHRSEVDMIDTSWNGEVISALYFRSIGKAPNVAAERSIRSLCLRRDSDT
jgi:hypothetical protein